MIKGPVSDRLSKQRRREEEGGVLAGVAGGGPPIRENSCPFVVQFKVPVRGGSWRIFKPRIFTNKHEWGGGGGLDDQGRGR